MPSVSINGKSYFYEQICVDCAPCDLPLWLSQQSVFPKVYWKDKEALFERAALGEILSLDSPPLFDIKTHSSLRFYGGVHFPTKKKEPIWEGFADRSFWLPRYEIIQTHQSTQLLVHFIDETPSLKPMQKLCWQATKIPAHSFSLLKVKHSLLREEWQKQIDLILKKIEEGAVEKIVLGRKTQLSFSKPPCIWDMIQRLKTQTLKATLFAFQLTHHTAFLGASPERLFFRKTNRIWVDILAATRPRGKSAAEDDLLEKQLLTGIKERKEFLIVEEYIRAHIKALSQHCTCHPPMHVLKTAHVQHLYSQLEALLTPGISDAMLIDRLHPTPAIGGSPRKEAVELLLELESFQRGWYSSPVGWISPEETDLVVAIRSCLLHDTQLHLFAAAGIVAQSIAEQEWEELDQKMRLMLYGCGLAQ